MGYDYYRYMNKRPVYNPEDVQLIVTEGFKPAAEGHEGDWAMLQTGWYVAVMKKTRKVFLKIMDAIEENDSEEFTKY